MTKPRIHFSPEKNWMNDPNGTICLNGTYHLFYQYNPDGCEWGNIQWAHASGQNLIDWQRHGCKLVPDASIDERYCFSGCSVRTPKGCKCFYTSIGFEKDAAQHHAKQLICDADTAFETITRNGYAVTDSVHPFPVSEWRDPFVFAFGGKWFMVLAGIRGKTSCIFLYEAQDEDLNHWQYIAPLYTIDTEQDMFECPNVAVFGNQIVLLYSLVKENVVKYVCGTFDGKKLTVSGEGYIDHGANCYYASNLARRDDGAYILFAWQKESLIGSASPDGTYSGCLAIPRIMTLDGNRVTFRFADALYDLRERELSTEREDARLKIAGTSERTLLSFDLQKNTEIAIRKNEKERVTLAFRNGFLRILRSSLCPNADERELTAPLPAGKTRVQILSDGTITEIMLGDRTAVSFRFYNQEPIECILEADADTIENLSAYGLRSARIQ